MDIITVVIHLLPIFVCDTTFILLYTEWNYLSLTIVILLYNAVF